MQTYKQQILDWEIATERWESMYYCHRDDVVFIEGENRAVKPGQIVPHAYRRA